MVIPLRPYASEMEQPVAERIRRELMVLPIYPDLSRSDLDDIIAVVTKVVEAYSA